MLIKKTELIHQTDRGLPLILDEARNEWKNQIEGAGERNHSHRKAINNLPNLQVSVIIRNRNGGPLLSKCLDSVLGSAYPHLEVIVVDDASTDGSADLVKENYLARGVKVVELKGNFGSAGSTNVGIRASSGEYLAVLDNDTQVDPNWLQHPLTFMASDPNIGVVFPLLLKPDGRCDSMGHLLHILCYPLELSFFSKTIPSRPYEVFGGKMAAMITRRELVEKIGQLDSSYRFYFDESDLCWRVHLTGFKVLIDPTSRVIHVGGATIGALTSFAIYNRQKNTLTSMLKYYSIGDLLIFLPIRLIFDAISYPKLLFRKRADLVMASLKGTFEALKAIGYSRSYGKPFRNSSIRLRDFVVGNIGILFRYLRWRLASAAV